MRSDGQFAAITPERVRLFVAARGRGLSVPDAAVEAGVSRASGYRLDRRVREVAAAAASTPPVPTLDDLAASAAEREGGEMQRKAKAAERSRRARAKKKAVPAKPERRQRAETREEFIARNRREREQARENPREHVFRASSIRAGSMTSRGYDHQDGEECELLARFLVEWGDSLLPEEVLVAALRWNDPYDFEQPLDLDAYAMKYAARVQEAGEPELLTPEEEAAPGVFEPEPDLFFVADLAPLPASERPD